MIVVVLGMHRAGTSMLSSVLHAMGVVMGPDEHLARHDPDSQPLGYWEDRGFVELNQDIITTAGGQWCNPPSPEAIATAGESFQDRINDLIADRDARLRWGWKDPRTCLTIGCYQAALTGRDVRYIRILRSRAAIADSLVRRGEPLSMPVDDLIADYEQRMADFFDRNDPPRLTVSYELMTDPNAAEGRVRRIADFLDIDAVMVGRGLAKIKMRINDR